MESLIRDLQQTLLQHDRWVGELRDFSHYQGRAAPRPRRATEEADPRASSWALDALTLLAVNLALWVVSLGVGKCWPVDFIWSNWPLYMAGAILVRGQTQAVSGKQGLIVGLVCFWGLRLTGNFLSRGGLGHEDWRYTDMRVYVGPNLFPLLSLPMVFLGQSTFMFLGCLSLYGALRNRFTVLSATDLVGVCVVLAAVVLETAADEQLDAFVDKKRRGELPGKAVLDTGLWGWSRHPNYFGECLFWWGLWILSGMEIGPALAGPALMTLLFLGISIPLMEERQLERKGMDYVDYQDRVPSPFVPLPRFLAARLCRWGAREEDDDDSPAQADDKPLPVTTGDKPLPPTSEAAKKQKKKR